MCSPVLVVPDEGNNASRLEHPSEFDGRLVVVRAPVVCLRSTHQGPERRLVGGDNVEGRGYRTHLGDDDQVGPSVLDAGVVERALTDRHSWVLDRLDELIAHACAGLHCAELLHCVGPVWVREQGAGEDARARSDPVPSHELLGAVDNKGVQHALDDVQRRDSLYGLADVRQSGGLVGGPGATKEA